MSHSHQSALEHFRTYGWVRIPAAFRAEDAAAMCDLIWAALGEVGIHRNDPSTWTTARPEHMKHLKGDSTFHAIGSARTLQTIDEVLEGQPWQKPRDWGAFFLQFPIGSQWDIPSRGWHIDGDYTGRLLPPCGVKVHAMLTDVGPRCGGVNILSGSHRLVHRWFSENPPEPGSRGAQFLHSRSVRSGGCGSSDQAVPRTGGRSGWDTAPGGGEYRIGRRRDSDAFAA